MLYPFLVVYQIFQISNKCERCINEQKLFWKYVITTFNTSLVCSHTKMCAMFVKKIQFCISETNTDGKRKNWKWHWPLLHYFELHLAENLSFFCNNYVPQNKNNCISSLFIMESELRKKNIITLNVELFVYWSHEMYSMYVSNSFSCQ